MTDVKKLDTPSTPDDAEADRLRDGIEQTRAGMSATISALETRLSPEEVRGRVGIELEHVEAKVRDVVREHLAEAKTLVKEELVEAKTLLRDEMNEAESKIKKGLSEARATLKEDLRVELETVETKIKDNLAQARDNVKKELHVAFEGAKYRVRAATLGKVEEFATNLGDTMNDTRDTLVDTVRNNPLPAALAGLGLVWLLMNRSKSARSNDGISASFDSRVGSYGGGAPTGSGSFDAARRTVNELGSALGSATHRASETVGHLAHDASSAASGAMHEASNAAGGVIHGASDYIGRVASQTADAAGAAAHGVGDVSTQLAHRAGDAANYVAVGARSQVRRVEQGLQSTLHESPLALGAVALVVGAAVGFSLPRTQVEDTLMGETRDTALHRAEGLAHDAAAAIGHLGEKTAEAVTQTMGATPSR